MHAGSEIKLQMTVLSFRLRGFPAHFGEHLLNESLENMKMDNNYLKIHRNLKRICLLALLAGEVERCNQLFCNLFILHLKCVHSIISHFLILIKCMNALEGGIRTVHFKSMLLCQRTMSQ